MSKSVRLARYLQWSLLAALLVVPQGGFRTLDANASLADPGRTAVLIPIRASAANVVPRTLKATIALLANTAPENVQRQTLSEDEVIENHSGQPYAIPEMPVFPLTQKLRPWILSDSNWKALDKFPLRFDCQIAQGRPYFGLHVVLPFGG